MPTVWRIIPSFEFLIKRWETMAGQQQYQGLRDALNDGVKNLRKWYGRVNSTSPGYFICLGKFFGLIYGFALNITYQSLILMSRTCTSGTGGAVRTMLLA